MMSMAVVMMVKVSDIHNIQNDTYIWNDGAEFSHSLANRTSVLARNKKSAVVWLQIEVYSLTCRNFPFIATQQCSWIPDVPAEDFIILRKTGM